MGTASPVCSAKGPEVPSTGPCKQPVSFLWLIPRAFTKLFITASCSLFIAWVADWLNESHSARFKLVESKGYQLQSPAAQSTPLLSGYDLEKILLHLDSGPCSKPRFSWSAPDAKTLQPPSLVV